ncbi:Zinc-type alcohol dehydrogenase-like protein [Sphaceloma murrayae]|uniref:Zinc-type alcohol dehydrogenase-like protein n=1 Tax=Sphaceloma murrayae TaxID=2082308 RepID=A0A2K1QZ32_9PEZI|nr:Zinc-type alcohol dehydrogenase-like protein [Sphaceloma murrayae]
MPFQYRKVLVVGASSGIGEALASKFVSEGSKVIVVGRRRENLDKFVSSHGADKSTALTFDITDLAGIPKFAESVAKDHRDLDCVFINSGIQRGFNFADPSSVDLSLLETELTTNYTSYIHLTMAFLPYLQKQANGGAFMYTTSGLAIVPLLRCPNYCASKAALHHWILCLRQQLKDASENIKVYEIFPPAVQTELHDEKHQPDIKNGRQIGMPLKDFTEEAYAGLAAGHEEVAVEAAKRWHDAVETPRQEAFHKMTAMMKQHK